MRQNSIKYFYLYFIVILIVLIVSIGTLSVLFNSTLQQQLIQYGLMVLNSDALYINMITNTVKDVFDSISFDPQISKLLNYEYLTASELNLGIQRLESYVNSNLYIDSIYIYNRKNDTFYVASSNSTESVYCDDSLFDEEALSIMKEDYSAYKNMQPIYREISVEYPYEDRISYISFLRYNTLKKENQSDVMMINVKLTNFSKLLEEFPDNNNLLLMLTDKNSKLVSFLQNNFVYNEDIINSILLKLQINDGNSFIAKEHDQKYVVCSIPVMNNGINLTLIADENNIGSITESRIYLFSVIAFVSVLVVVCAIAAIAIVKLIVNLNISHREEMQKLEKEKSRLAFEHNRRRLLSILCNEDGDIEIQDLLDGVDSETLCHLCLVFINSYYSKVSIKYELIKDRNKLKQNICNCIVEKLSQYNVLLSTYDDDAKCYLAFKYIENGKYLDSLSEARKTIKEIFDIDVSIFISSPIGFSQLSIAQNELREALPYRIILDSEDIITSQMLDAREMYSSKMPQALMKNLTENILQLNIDSVLINLKEIIEEISGGSYKSFQKNLLQLAFNLDDVLGKLQANNGIEKSVYIDSVLHDISSFENLDEIYRAFKDVIVQASQLVIKNKKDHQVNLISQIQDIAKENYRSKDFSIITVSEIIGMNASYLGKLFKKNMGQTFIEFVHDVRMNAACDLLKNTDMEISDIVSNVGYSDIPYFYKMFKKINGCTPVVYRQTNSI